MQSGLRSNHKKPGIAGFFVFGIAEQKLRQQMLNTVTLFAQLLFGGFHLLA